MNKIYTVMKKYRSQSIQNRWVELRWGHFQTQIGKRLCVLSLPVPFNTCCSLTMTYCLSMFKRANLGYYVFPNGIVSKVIFRSVKNIFHYFRLRIVCIDLFKTDSERKIGNHVRSRSRGVFPTNHARTCIHLRIL